jgi:hypothetical protein
MGCRPGASDRPSSVPAERPPARRVRQRRRLLAVRERLGQQRAARPMRRAAPTGGERVVGHSRRWPPHGWCSRHRARPRMRAPRPSRHGLARIRTCRRDCARPHLRRTRPHSAVPTVILPRTALANHSSAAPAPDSARTMDEAGRLRRRAPAPPCELTIIGCRETRCHGTDVGPLTHRRSRIPFMRRSTAVGWMSSASAISSAGLWSSSIARMGASCGSRRSSAACACS